MSIINQKDWETIVKVNTDAYGKCCVDIAREVMKLLDNDGEFDAHQIILDAQDNIGESGITGFMAGMIAQIVINCHSRGKEFNAKWNRHYGVESDEGVVNPAILIMKT